MSAVAVEGVGVAGLQAEVRRPLPVGLTKAFRDLVRGRCGLYFKDHALSDLEEAVRERMRARGLDSAAAYYSFITAGPDCEAELRELLNLLTTRHTYFLRNEPQFRVLREKVLPELVARKLAASGPVLPGADRARPSLRIWSAGCSTGEEPYSIAMTVREVIGDCAGWDIEIAASDASTEALEKAREAVYGDNAVRLVGAPLKERYFTPARSPDGAPRYALRPAVRDMVRFDYLNLISDPFPAGFDIIFCRNVVIYFDLETTIAVMDRLHHSLAEDGYLFIGYSETLQFISDRFRMHHGDGAIVYRKAGGPREPAPAAAPPLPFAAEAVIEKMSRAEVEAEEKREERAGTQPAAGIEDLLVEITKALHLKDHGKALALCARARAADRSAVEPYYLAAEAYANQGRRLEARQELARALETGPLFAPAHYLLGAIQTDEGDLEEARESMKRALYLDRDFAVAHFALAGILQQQGRGAEALRAYRNTLKVLSARDPADVVAHGGGFTVASLMGACSANVERIRGETWNT